MLRDDRKFSRLALTIVAGLLFVGALSLQQGTNNDLTGAVAGSTTIYDQCLTEDGKNLNGKWEWDRIKECREKVLEIESHTPKDMPRVTYLLSVFESE